MKSLHTKKPWIMDEETGEIEALVDPENSQTYYAPVAFLDMDWKKEIWKANGKLITEAPEMYDVLKAVRLQLRACLDIMSEFQKAEETPIWIEENSATRVICGSPELEKADAIIAKIEEKE